MPYVEFFRLTEKSFAPALSFFSLSLLLYYFHYTYLGATMAALAKEVGMEGVNIKSLPTCASCKEWAFNAQSKKHKRNKKRKQAQEQKESCNF